MGKFTKWLGAGLGFTLGGPIGAIIGFTLGNFVDGFTLENGTEERGRRKVNTQSGDFEISLLILASVVIKADGKVSKQELDYVRMQFVSMYGKERANRNFKLFNEIIRKEISVRQICFQIRDNMTHSSRLQLLHFLFGIAKADGYVADLEVKEIKKISGYLYINQHDYESIKAMFYNTSDSAYKILEITKNVADSEVKKAYRKMAKKYHPDKLQGLDEEHLKGANEKFQKIQEAYDNIKKERGL